MPGSLPSFNEAEARVASENGVDPDDEPLALDASMRPRRVSPRKTSRPALLRPYVHESASMRPRRCRLGKPVANPRLAENSRGFNEAEARVASENLQVRAWPTSTLARFNEAEARVASENRRVLHRQIELRRYCFNEAEARVASENEQMTPIAESGRRLQ